MSMVLDAKANGFVLPEEKQAAYLATAYMDYLTEQIEISSEQVDAYYDAHAEDLAAQYVTKDDTNVVNVRRILGRYELAVNWGNIMILDSTAATKP